MNRKAWYILGMAFVLLLGGIFLGPWKREEIAGRKYKETMLLLERRETANEAERDGDIEKRVETEAEMQTQKEFIKWVDFHVSYEALCCAYETELLWHEKHPEREPVWVSLLAITACRSGGTFGKEAFSHLKQLCSRILEEETTIEEEYRELKSYPYYKEAYDAVLSELVGEYEMIHQTGDGIQTVEHGYGLKAFSPIAKGFYYSDYDDFGVSRSYGFRRQHLGHDMMGQIGTPIIAVESGMVECLGWNQYGGWRIGIRSFDKKRYYYYAHLRQNYPYAEGLKEGQMVSAGQVIGYLGHTGYSVKENVNNIDEPHLHFGLQLIFDESQKECNSEIWIDCYALISFLRKNQSPVEKVGDTREWISLRTLSGTIE